MALYSGGKLADAVAQWFCERCEAFGEEQSSALYEDFRVWLVRDNQCKALRSLPGRTAFGEALGAQGFERTVRRGLTHYVGIALRSREDL